MPAAVAARRSITPRRSTTRHAVSIPASWWEVLTNEPWQPQRVEPGRVRPAGAGGPRAGGRAGHRAERRSEAGDHPGHRRRAHHADSQLGLRSLLADGCGAADLAVDRAS